MGYIRKPSYFFGTDTETGINELSVGSVISVASYASGAPKQFQKLSLGTLTGASTVADAVNVGNLVEIGTGAGGGSVSVTDNVATDSTYYPMFVDVTTGAPTVTSVSSTKLQFNPLAGNLSSTTFTSLSDIAKKENVLTASSDIINKLRGVEFTWKDSGKKSSGVIAQEVETILPHIIETLEDGTKTVNYMALSAYLIESIKALEERVKALEV